MTFTVQTYKGSDGQVLRYGKLVDSASQASTPLVYVPGLGGSVKGALHFLEALLPVYGPIYGVDLRGFGLNSEDITPGDAQQTLADLTCFLDEVMGEDSPPAALAGISLGAAFSVQLAIKYPERFRSLCLFAPAFKPSKKSFSPGYTWKNILGRVFLGERYKTPLPYDITSITRNPEVLADPQYFGEKPLQLTADYLLDVDRLCRHSLTLMQQISMSTLMVIPGADLVCDPEAMRQGYQSIPAGTPKQCKEFEVLYHDVLLEPEWSEVADLVKTWAVEPLTESSSRPLRVE
ncbi:MAG: lysophospholipase [Vampirovibrio sp.]|nr:lysophospholipase [Vampirovibrio sp.]